jgi:hypothetical protein
MTGRWHHFTPLPNDDREVIRDYNCRASIRAVGVVDSVDEPQFSFDLKAILEPAC